MPFYSKMDDLHLDDQIKVLVARATMRAGQKDRQVKKIKGNLKTTVSNESIINYLKDYLNRIEISQSKSYRKGFKRMHDIDPVTRPMGVSVGHKLDGSTRIVKVPNDVRVIKALEILGIGRPSTVAYHAGKISQKFLSDDGFVNKKGDMAISTAKRLVPNLLKKEHQEVVDFLINNVENKELDYELRASKALSVMGISTPKKGEDTGGPGQELPYGLNS
jgi:hypothetical protein